MSASQLYFVMKSQNRCVSEKRIGRIENGRYEQKYKTKLNVEEHDKPQSVQQTQELFLELIASIGLILIQFIYDAPVT
jgi:hypothetical protein